MTDAETSWATRLAATLAGTGGAPVTAIGERAARLIDAAAAVAPPAAGDGAPPGTGSGSAPGAAPDAPAAPRFATLADCERAAPGHRGEHALLTLDALGAGGATGSARTLDRALGAACRLYPARLLLFVDTAEAPPAEALFAFGFRRLIVHRDGALHEYRLRDYKLPPDWLNARFWANPERFGLEDDEPGDLEDDDEDEDDEDDDENEEDDGVEGR